MFHLKRLVIKRRIIIRRYSTSKLSFTKLDDDGSSFNPDIFNSKTNKLDKLERNNDKLTLQNIQKQIGVLDLNLLGKVSNKEDFQISDIPSWYERLVSPSTYKIYDDITIDHENIPYRSFNRCYNRVLSVYADEFICLDSPAAKNIQLSLLEKNLPEQILQQQMKVELVSKKLNEVSSNSFIIYNRLRIKRMAAPFFLHQQFLVNLNEKNVARLVEIYFELPNPKPLHLKREEFEKFMTLLLGLKVSEDHKTLLPKIIEIYEDIKINGHGIKLTPFENTKYLSFLLNLWNEQGISQDIKFERIINLKLNDKGKSDFCPGMWNVFLSHFPERTDEIMKMMSHEVGITRTNVQIFLNYVKSYDELNNALELMKLKYFHLDPTLLTIIIEKHIEFGKEEEALLLLTYILRAFVDISDLNWQFLPQRIERKEIFKFDILNKTYYQLHINDTNLKHEWLRYKFKPNPLVISKLAASLSDENQYKLLELMNQQNIPLANKYAINILEQKSCDFKTLSVLAKLVKNSNNFNKELHNYSTDAKFNTKYLNLHIIDSSNDVFNELATIFQLCIQRYQKMNDIPGMETERGEAAQELVSLNQELKIVD